MLSFGSTFRPRRFSCVNKPMALDGDKKSNIAIWRIDKNIDSFSGKTADQIIDAIRETANKKRTVEPLELSVGTYEDKRIRGLRAKRFSEGWSGFLQGLLGAEYTESKIRDVFANTNKDLVLFLYDDENIFAITSGGGYHIIQNFIDERFPFEVAKRMLTGEFKSADVRDLTGAVYSQSRNFRRDYNFSRREAFGKVWKKLTGKIDPSLIRGSENLAGFLPKDSKKVFNADIKSSFTFRKSVTLEQIIDIAKEIEKLLKGELTDEQKRTFSFLDTLKEVTTKKAKEKLRDALPREIYDFVRSDSQNCDELDFCHPREMSKFLAGTGYKLTKELTWNETPTATNVLVALRNADPAAVDMSNFDAFKETFLSLSFSFLEEDEGITTYEDLWKYFHGEIESGGKKYFLIDAKWYEVVGDFLKRLSEDFQNEVFEGRAILSTDVPFIEWRTGSEGDFNRAQSAQDNFYFGDEVFLKKSEKGKIELFDLLYESSDRVYIIQVKDGFGAAIRNACSQIQMAAEIIENAISSGDYADLNSYYIEFAKENAEVSHNLFVALLKKERVYVLAFATRAEFTQVNFQADQFQSEIARFEVLGISHEFRANDRDFRIANVRKV